MTERSKINELLSTFITNEIVRLDQDKRKREPIRPNVIVQKTRYVADNNLFLREMDLTRPQVKETSLNLKSVKGPSLEGCLCK